MRSLSRADPVEGEGDSICRPADRPRGYRNLNASPATPYLVMVSQEPVKSKGFPATDALWEVPFGMERETF